MNTTHAKTLTFVIGVCLGVVVGEVSMSASEVAVFAVVLILIQTGLYFWERKREQVSNNEVVAHLFSFPLITILFSLGLFLGIVRVQLVEPKTSFVCESICTFDAKIISSSETKNDYQIFNVHTLSSGSDILDVQVSAPLYPKYQIGETLKISGKVNIPDVIYPHGDTKAFDYESYLRTKNIGSEISYPKIEVINIEAHTFGESLGRWKENLILRIDKYVSPPASSLAGGMLFGASSVSKDLLQTFRVAGLSHIIVLSGFNIVIVIVAILFVLSFLPLLLRIILASVSVIIFVMMVGAEPSVIRATLMAFIALLAMITGREYVARQAFIISLFVIVMYEPYSLLNSVSIHLSFLATMGLVYMSEPIKIFLQKYFPLEKTSSLREIFVTTISAYLATLPYIMYTFGTMSVYALLANILVLPFIPIAMLVSFLIVVGSYLSNTLASLFGFVDTLLINFLIWIARGIESLPFSSFTLTISFAVMCTMYVLIFLFIKYIFFKNKNETNVTYDKDYISDVIPY